MASDPIAPTGPSSHLIRITLPTDHPWCVVFERARQPAKEGRRVWGNPEATVSIGLDGEWVRATVCGYDRRPRWEGDDKPPSAYFLQPFEVPGGE